MEWKPIEIKPKDNSDVLVYFGNGFIEVCNWCEKEKEWQRGGYNIIGARYGGSEPTHWMPLPRSPWSSGANNTALGRAVGSVSTTGTDNTFLGKKKGCNCPEIFKGPHGCTSCGDKSYLNNNEE